MRRGQISHTKQFCDSSLSSTISFSSDTIYLETALNLFVIGGSGVLALSTHTQTKCPEAHREGCGSVVWFIDDVQLRTFPSWCPNIPSLFVLPYKRSNLVFNKARIKATAQSLCYMFKYSPVQCQASLVCVSSCSPLLCCGIQPPSWRPWATWP